jgi:hypothetical protein
MQNLDQLLKEKLLLAVFQPKKSRFLSLQLFLIGIANSNDSGWMAPRCLSLGKLPTRQSPLAGKQFASNELHHSVDLNCGAFKNGALLGNAQGPQIGNVGPAKLHKMPQCQTSHLHELPRARLHIRVGS